MRCCGICMPVAELPGLDRRVSALVVQKDDDGLSVIPV